MAFSAQDIVFEKTRQSVKQIDTAIVEDLETYMCREQCPCDSRGKLENI